MIKPPRWNVSAALVAPRYRPLWRGLLGRWIMWEGAGTRLIDISGNGNHATFVGAPAWIVGQGGPALSFDGDDDWLDAGNDKSLDTSTEMTMALWLTVAAFDKQWQTPISKGNCAYQIRRNSNEDELIATFRDGTCTTLHGDFDLITLDVNLPGWHHIVATYSQPAGVARMFHNAEMISEVSVSGTLGATADPVRIGQHNAGADRQWQGFIDDVGIWNRALSKAEVRSLYYDPFGSVYFSSGRPVYPHHTALRV